MQCYIKAVLIGIVLSLELLNSFSDGARDHNQYVEHDCIHDKIAPQIKRVNQIPSRKRRSEEVVYSNNRIYVHADSSLVDSEEFSFLWKNKKSPLWKAVETMSRGLLVQSTGENVTIAPACEIFTAGENSGYCINGTLVQQCGLFDYPDYLAAQEYVCNSENGSCGYEGIQGPGVDADYILIAGVTDDENCGNTTLAFASLCNIEPDHYRPINGYINICSKNVQGSFPLVDVENLLYNLLVHEITHAMGFSVNFFPYYGDTYPLVVRYLSNFGFFYGLKTPKLNDHVREYFNCTQVDYAPLENNGGLGSAGSHWEARIFHHETMTAFISYDYQVYSNVTWHMFHDSQWYDVNYTFTNSLDQFELQWGKGEGCTFIEGDCNKEEEYKYACDGSQSQCTFDRIAKGFCGGSFFFDGCNVVQSYTDGSCLYSVNYYNQDDADVLDLTQRYGRTSRCFEVQNVGGNCQHTPACFEAKVYKHSETNQHAYQIIGHENFTDGPVWCLEGKHVTLGSEYVLCPTIEEILLHFDPEDIIVADEFVPPPLCHDSCLTCEVAHDSSQCLTCHEGEELTGNAPNACNGTGYQEIECVPEVEQNFCADKYSGCCIKSEQDNCRIDYVGGSCYCDYTCHSFGDCCTDIVKAGCPKKVSTTSAVPATTTSIAEVVSTTETSLIVTHTTEVLTTETTTIFPTTTLETSTIATTTEEISTTTDSSVFMTETTTVVPTTTLETSTIAPTTEEISTTTDSTVLMTETTTIVVPTTTLETSTIAPTTEEISTTTDSTVLMTETTTVVPTTTLETSTIAPTTEEISTTTDSTVLTTETTTIVPTTTLETSTIAPMTEEISTTTDSTVLTTETTTIVPTTTLETSTIAPTTEEISTTTDSTVLTTETTTIVPTTTLETSTIAPMTEEISTTTDSTVLMTETTTIVVPTTTLETSTIAPMTEKISTTTDSSVLTTETTTIVPTTTLETSTIAPTTEEISIKTDSTMLTTETTTVVPTTTLETSTIAPTTEEISITTDSSVFMTETTTIVVPTTTLETSTITPTTTEEISTTTDLSVLTTETTTESLPLKSSTVSVTTTPIPSPLECINNEIRIGMENVVEWCVDNSWASVCYDSTWDFRDAVVLCNQLGLQSSGAYTGWADSSEHVPSRIKRVNCKGDEKSIDECPYDVDDEQSCISNRIATAFCVSGISDCETCSSPVECVVSGIPRGTSVEVFSLTLSCSIESNQTQTDLSTSDVDPFDEILYLSETSTSFVSQIGIVTREQIKAEQEQCVMSDEFPQHGDPIVTLQEIGIETLTILYQDTDGFPSIRDLTHSELRKIILSDDFSNVFSDEIISCSFQHLLYWITRVPSFAPIYCRQQGNRNTIISVQVHCDSPFSSCEEALRSEGSASGYYPIVGSNGSVDLHHCM